MSLDDTLLAEHGAACTFLAAERRRSLLTMRADGRCPRPTPAFVTKERVEVLLAVRDPRPQRFILGRSQCKPQTSSAELQRTHRGWVAFSTRFRHNRNTLDALDSLRTRNEVGGSIRSVIEHVAIRVG